MVKTVKQLLSESNDPYLALLTYRATPLPWCYLSPSELYMGRKIRMPVPQTNKFLVSKWPYLPEFWEKNASFKDRQKKNFDTRHILPDIPDDTEVWVNSGAEPVRGRVINQVNTYVVSTPSGEVRRNRQHLNIVPQQGSQQGLSETFELETPLIENTEPPADPPQRYSYTTPRMTILKGEKLWSVL